MVELSGCLRDFGLTVILRFLADQNCSGCLTISRAGWTGEVFLDEGRVVGAAAAEECGKAALDLIGLALADGDFVYADGPQRADPDMDMNDASLLNVDTLMSGLASRATPLLQSIPRLTDFQDDNSDQQVPLSRRDVSILLDVDGRRNVEEILRERTTLQALHSLIRLNDLGLLHLQPPNDSVVDAGAATNGFDERTIAEDVEHATIPSRSPPWGRAGVLRTLAQTAVLTALFVLGMRLLMQSIHVEGQSMLPGLVDGDLVLVNRAAYLFSGPQRGDVIVFRSPASPDSELVKRVIAMPGERVWIEEGNVFVDDRVLAEPYKVPGASSIARYPRGDGSVEVPPNNYFVLGDNRAVSLDSRQGWFVSVDKLIGRVWLTYWPPTAWGFVAQAATGEIYATPVSSNAAANPADAPESVTSDSSGPGPAELSTPTVADSQPILARVVLDGDVAYQSGWPNDSSGAAWLDGSRYRLVGRRPAHFVAVTAPVVGIYADVLVSATLHKSGGPPGGGYGLIVRDQEPVERRDGSYQGGRFYVAAVSDVGEVGLWQRDEDHWLDLIPWTPSPSVHQRSASNELNLRAEGSNLTLVVNGIEAFTYTEAVLPAGRVGAFVGGDLNEVVLDRFSIELPATTLGP